MKSKACVRHAFNGLVGLLALVALLVSVRPPRASKHSNTGDPLEALPGVTREAGTGQDSYLTTEQLASSLDHEESCGESEDPELIEAYAANALLPHEYRRAVKLLHHNTRRTAEGGPPIGPWEPMGPVGNLASADYNGRMTGIHIRTAGSHTWYFAGSVGGGLWFGVDGPYWESIGDALPNPSVRAFSVHPGNALDIFVGTGDWRRYVGGGMYRTTTGGTVWEEVTLPINPDTGRPYAPDFFFRIIHKPSDPNTLFAAAGSGERAYPVPTPRATHEGGVFEYDYTTDIWRVSLAGSVTDLAIDPSDPDVMYACRYHDGVYKYSSGAWDKLDDPTLPDGGAFDRASIAICRDSPQDLALVVENGGSLAGVFKSPDGGDTWTDITSGAEKLSSQIWHAQAVTFRPNYPAQLFVGSMKLYIYNAGTGWDAGSEIGHADITQLYFSQATGDDVLWVLNDGGIYRRDLTDDTLESWNGDGETGLQCSQVYHLDTDFSMLTIGMQDNGIASSNTGESAWTFLKGGDGWDSEIINSRDSAPTDFYASVADPPGGCGAMLRRYIAGVHSEPILSSCVGFLWYDRLRNTLYSQGRKDDFTVCRNSTGTPCVDSSDCPGDEICNYNNMCHVPCISDACRDECAPARRIVSHTLPVEDPPAWVDEIVLPPWSRSLFGSYLDRTLYMTYSRRFYRPSTVTVARWNGTGWNVEHRDPVGSAQVPTRVYPSLERLGESWMGLGGVGGQPKIVHTTDFWEMSEDITANLSPVGQVAAIAVVPFQPEQIYVGTDVGVFRTENGGASWEPFQDGLPIVGCMDLRYVKRTSGVDTLIVATFGRGIWSRDIKATPVVYVDARAEDYQDGTLKHPFDTFESGLAAVPDGGVLGLHGDTYIIGRTTINKPVELNAYETRATLR